MPDFIIVGSDGTEHHFPEGMDPKRAIQTVRNSELQAANKKPLHEPTDWWGGFRKGADDFATDVGRAGLETMAHPGIDLETGQAKSRLDTLADMSSLALPSMVGARAPVIRGMKTESAVEPIGNRVLKAGARGLAEAADFTPKIVNSPGKKKVIQGLRTFGNGPSVALESPQEAMTRRRVPPAAGGVQTDRIPYGGHQPVEATAVPETVETAQEALGRRGSAPTSGPTIQGDRVPYGGHTPYEVETPSVVESIQEALARSPQHEATTPPVHTDRIPYGGHQPDVPEMFGVDHHLPNSSGEVTLGIDMELPEHSGPIVETPQEALARGSAERGTGAIQTDRVPYGAAEPPVPTEAAGPTMEEILTSALQELRAAPAEGPAATTLSEVGEVGGTQKPKVGKRPGGYTTDLPPVTETQYNEMQGKGKGSAPVDDGELILNDEMLRQLIDQFGGRETRGATGVGDDVVERLRPSPRGKPQVARQRIDNAAIEAQGDRGSVARPESISDVLKRMYEQLAKEKP